VFAANIFHSEVPIEFLFLKLANKGGWFSFVEFGKTL
jgi:hypothetical protein